MEITVAGQSDGYCAFVAVAIKIITINIIIFTTFFIYATSLPVFNHGVRLTVQLSYILYLQKVFYNSRQKMSITDRLQIINK